MPHRFVYESGKFFNIFVFCLVCLCLIWMLLCKRDRDLFILAAEQTEKWVFHVCSVGVNMCRKGSLSLTDTVLHYNY